MEIIQQDQNYLQAFRNLHLLPYSATHQQSFFRRNEGTLPRHRSKTSQAVRGLCRCILFDSKKESRKFRRSNGKYHFYISRLYGKAFFTRDTICADTQWESDTNQDVSGIDKHSQELKRFIFQPGQEVELPFIGKRSAVFSERMRSLYRYTLRRDTLDFLFTVQAKDVARTAGQDNTTIIKFMEPYFGATSFQVVKRRYLLQYAGTLFSFDVYREADIAQRRDRYVPIRVFYHGKWYIPTRRIESCDFEMRMLEAR